MKPQPTRAASIAFGWSGRLMSLVHRIPLGIVSQDPRGFAKRLAHEAAARQATSGPVALVVAIR